MKIYSVVLELFHVTEGRTDRHGENKDAFFKHFVPNYKRDRNGALQSGTQNGRSLVTAVLAQWSLHLQCEVCRQLACEQQVRRKRRNKTQAQQKDVAIFSNFTYGNLLSSCPNFRSPENKNSDMSGRYPSATT